MHVFYLLLSDGAIELPIPESLAVFILSLGVLLKSKNVNRTLQKSEI